MTEFRPITGIGTNNGRLVSIDCFQTPDGEIWSYSTLRNCAPSLFNYLAQVTSGLKKIDWHFGTVLYHLETGGDLLRARRLLRCTKEFPCWDQHLCPRCRRYRANRIIRQVWPAIQNAQRRLQRHRLDSVSAPLKQIRREIRRLLRQLKRTDTSQLRRDRQLTRFKVYLRHEISNIRIQIKSNLKDYLNVVPSLAQLGYALKLTKLSGDVPIVELSSVLEETLGLLRVANRYIWVVLGLTLKVKKTLSNAIETLNSKFGELWKSMLNAPYAGALRLDEVSTEGTNVHVNVIYFGPYHDHQDILERWEELTGNKVVYVKPPRYGVKGSTKALVRYSHEIDKICPRVQVDFWRQHQRQHLWKRYGIFQGRAI